MAKPNYNFEKRQRELKKAKKQEEKRQKKLERARELQDDEPTPAPEAPEEP